MADWYGNRHNETYTYKRVAWENWVEHEAYPWITSGSLELSSSSDLKLTGSFDFEGMEPPNTSDLLRVYYEFDDDNGEHATCMLATLFVSYASLEHIDTTKGIKSKGTLEGSSVLKLLDEKVYGAPYTIPKNTNAIYKAQSLIKEVGLNVVYTPAIPVLSADHTFDAGDSYLDMVNWLCETAGYVPAYPDAEGNVVLKPHSAILNQTPEIVFENNANSIMYPQIEEENEWQKTPNVVKMFYNTDLACIYAEARNTTGSRVSLDARGNREQTFYEEIGELPEDASKVRSLVDLAEAKLRELSCDIEYVKFEHAYVPMQPYQAITVNYSDLSWSGIIDNTSIDLAPSTKAQTKLKRELYSDIVVQKEGRVLRGEE